MGASETSELFEVFAARDRVVICELALVSAIALRFGSVMIRGFQEFQQSLEGNMRRHEKLDSI